MATKICLNLIAFVFLLLAVSLSSRISAEVRKGNLTLTLICFVHFFTFGSWLGSQFWTTFIAGATMYYNMSRHAFGDIQSKLFPKYFLSGVILSAIALATYCLMNPVELWTRSEFYQCHSNENGLRNEDPYVDKSQKLWKLIQKLQVSGLAASLFACLLNYIYLEPKTLLLMNERYSYEKARGYGHEIGPINDPSLKKDEKYIEMTHRFACVHGFSSMTNIISFAGCVLHLWYLAASLKVA